MSRNNNGHSGLEVAIIGISCRFPGAADWREFWENLKEGREAMQFLSDEELLALGVDRSRLADERYVRVKASLANKDRFDAAFFGYRPGDAALMSPANRIFHECVWTAFEDAGYDPGQLQDPVALFAGGGDDLSWRLYTHLNNGEQGVDTLTLNQINNKDYLASLISYKLNFKGPVIAMNTACSTALVAVNLACKSLLFGEAGLALAGAVSVSTQAEPGYMYQEGMISSVDGHCRAFDRDATGTVGSEGAAVVVLKRLSDAVRDRDHIYAVIRGSAINSDGGRKVGFTAPSIQGQAECIKKAQSIARVDPSSIGYVETHGTGTRLGDPIEIEALNIAFDRRPGNHCAIGSVKTNIGHTDTAAGAAGLIKAVLSLKYRQIPPSLYFREPNPEIDFNGGPFFVNTTLRDWQEEGGHPPRAAVSAMGIGGTNAHLILEAAPAQEAGQPGRAYKLLTVSAKSRASLQGYVADLRAYLTAHPETDAADMAYTLQTGRRGFSFRNSFVFRDVPQLMTLLAAESPAVESKDRRRVVFMFPGVGSQYINMGRDLYRQDEEFKDSMDRGFRQLEALTGRDFRQILYPDRGGDGLLYETAYAHPLIFLMEYALAKRLMSVGIQPDYLIGHSLGEYVAACISGVFSYEDAIRLVVRRSEIMTGVAHGAMISVSIGEEAANVFLGHGVSLAAVNGPGQVVLSGDAASIDKVIADLDRSETDFVRLRTIHAFHSSMQEPLLEAYRAELEQLTLHPARIPFISNVTGGFIDAATAATPEYWVQHMRHTVRFSDGLTTLFDTEEEPVFIEVGAGYSLASLLRQHKAYTKTTPVIHVVRSLWDEEDDLERFTRNIGDLWALGVSIDWPAYYRQERRRRIPLPAYHFEPEFYKAEVSLLSLRQAVSSVPQERTPANWLYFPSWSQTAGYQPVRRNAPARWLFFSPDRQFSDAVSHSLLSDEDQMVCVFPGSGFTRMSDNSCLFDPDSTAGFGQLLDFVREKGGLPTDIVYAWGMRDGEGYAAWFGLVQVLQAFLSAGHDRWRLVLLTDRLYRVTGTEDLSVMPALLTGLAMVATQEHPISCLHIDIDTSQPMTSWSLPLATELSADNATKHCVVALRHGLRWTPVYIRQTKISAPQPPVLKQGGVYLVTGGLGSLGFVLAAHLMKKYGARVILTGRSPVDPAVPGEKGDRLRQLMAIGQNVHYMRADIARAEELGQLVLEAEREFGRVDGVVHAAGIVDNSYFELIEDMTKERTLGMFYPKIEGLKAVFEVFRDRQPDFVWIASSLAALVGGLGYGSYAAANAFMNHFVAAQEKSLASWKNLALGETAFGSENPDLRALSSDEFIGVFEWSLGLRDSPVIFESIPDLAARLVATAPAAESRNAAPTRRAKRERSGDSPGYVAPVNETEWRLAAIVEDFFGIEPVGMTDNFFELGGDSLKGMILLRSIKKAFAVDMPLRDFFRCKNIRQLAVAIGQLSRAGAPPVAGESGIPLVAGGSGTSLVAGGVGIPPVDGGTEIPLVSAAADYPLSAAQRRLWILHQLSDGGIVYNMRGAYLFKGQVDAAALEYAFRSLIERHETLRTVFRENAAGEARQVVLEAALSGFSLVRKDLRGQADRQAVVAEMLREDGLTPFDLARGPLLRAGLYRLEEEESVFSYSIHHIISDGWSMDILIRELMSVYSARLSGGVAQLPPLRIQYKEYAAWQRQQLDGDGMRLQKEYWLERLSGSLPVLELPTDQPRSRIQAFRGGMIRRRLPEQQVKGLRQLCREEGTSLFMGLLAAVTGLLHRYSGSEDIIVGTPTAGRGHSDLDNQIGFYVNTLALRTRLKGSDSFRQLLDAVKDTTLGAYENQDYPFDELAAALIQHRDPGRNPIFDVAVVMENYDWSGGPAAKPGPFEISPWPLGDYTISKFDLSYIFSESGEAVVVYIEYNSDMWNADSIHRMADAFSRLLDALLMSPDDAIGKAALLDESERQKVLQDFNLPDHWAPVLTTIVQAFEQQVEQTPQKTALVVENRTLSYEELNTRANQLAHFLRSGAAFTGNGQQGLQVEELVAVLLPRDERMIIALLAILKAGGAYLPLDTGYPQHRIDYMLTDCQCRLVLDEQTMDNYSAAAAGCSRDNPDAANGPADLAYVMYTSGSTGNPKGVMIEHRSVVRLVKPAGYVELDGEEVLLSTGALSFDATTFEFWGMLLNGGRLVLCPVEELLNENSLHALIGRNQVNMIWLTTGFFNQLVNTQPQLFAGLKTVLTGGEKISPDHIRILLEKYPALNVFNCYGPTENTTFTLTCRVGSVDDIPIGRPIRNTRVYVLNSQGEPQPVGVVGEIYIGGVGLARGYLNNPELTEEKFVPDPFLPGERLYRSGDLGYWMPDGNIGFAGRNDDQVKIRGFRIEPGEVAGALRQHPDIDEALVLPVSRTPNEKQLVAYILAGGAVPTAPDLRSFLQRSLPDHMIPALFVLLDAFPLTPNGKVDRKALPDPFEYGMSAGAEFKGPETATQTLLAEIWQERLGMSTVGITDNFFSLGGHSLIALKLVMDVRSRMNKKLSVKMIFQLPTIRELAAHLDSLDTESAEPGRQESIVPAIRIYGEDYYAATYIQRYWIDDNIDAAVKQSDPVHGQVQMVFDIDGHLQPDVLRAALERLFLRHESLRTVFCLVDDQPLMKVESYEEGRLPFEVKMAVAGQEPEGFLYFSDGKTRADRHPLIKFRLLRLDAARFVLSVLAHHVIMDGWSMSLLMRDLIALYYACRDHRAEALPELTTQLKEQLSLISRYNTDNNTAHRSFWEQRWPTLPDLPVIPGHNGTSVGMDDRLLATAAYSFPSGAMEKVHQLVLSSGANQFVVLQAGFLAWLFSSTGQNDVLTGTYVLGREFEGAENVIGCFSETRLIRTALDPDDTMLSAIQKVGTSNDEMNTYRAYTFLDRLYGLCHEKPVPAEAYWKINFQYATTGAGTTGNGQTPGLSIVPRPLAPNRVAAVDVQLYFSATGQAINLDIEYDSSAYDRAAIDQLVAGYMNYLERITPSGNILFTF